MRRIMITLGGTVMFMLLSLGLFGCRAKADSETTYKAYVDYLKSVYEIMDKNYYMPVKQEVFNNYIIDFRTRIFEPQVKDKSKVDEGIKQVATGIMVSKLKDPSDPFTNFFPPPMVKQFKESTLGYAAGDIGLEGSLKDGRFIITQVEPLSDAFKKGILIADEVVKIENKAVSELTEDVIRKIFSPPVGQEVSLELFSPKLNKAYSAKVISSQYFKQSVFLVSTGDPNVACLRIKAFNEQTGNEMRSDIDNLNKSSIKKLIIDLRGNGGGPPLAAWDISGVFLEPDQKLFYFMKRNEAPNGLVSAPSPVKFNGDTMILINKGTGSASELFAGLMRAYNKAKLIGDNSAGQVFLKSIFDLSDGATLELTVAKGFLFNGDPIDFSGLNPDIKITDNTDLIKYAVNLLEKKDVTTAPSAQPNVKP